MKTEKHNEILKVAAVTALSIGVFSSVFVGGNQIVLSSAINQQISMPSTQTAMDVLGHINTVPENYPFQAFETKDTTSAETQRSANALSPEKAAELGARYIWEVLGENVDGRTIYMSYQTQRHTARTYWSGSVTIGENREAIIMFNIDSVSGERISINDTRREETNLPERTMTMGELLESENTTPDNIEPYAELAREFAQKHFHISDVVDIEFSSMQPVIVDRGDRDAGVSAILTYRERLLRFNATDERGRVALVIISMDTHRLHQISTQRNDVVPGFEFNTIPETHMRGN